MSAPPRTLVVGIGAIGGFVAARLTAAGWPLAALARGETLQTLSRGPLRLVDGDTEHQVPLNAVADPAPYGPFELVLICVKSHHTAAAAAQIAHTLAPQCVVISLQNGVENPATIAAACPDAHVGAAAVYLGCQTTEPGVVVRRPSRDPDSGALRDRLAGGGPGLCPRRLTQVAQALGIPAEVTTDPAPALWTKLVANASLNTVTALGRARVGDLWTHPGAVELMERIGQETAAVARACGVDIPADAGRAYVADARRRLPASGGSSTLFDLEAGRRLEHRAMIGAVVRAARPRAVATPACEICLGMLDLAERAALSER